MPIPLNDIKLQHARIFIAGALSAAAKSIERASDASPTDKEAQELHKLADKLNLAADEYWRRARLEVVDDAR